VSDPALTVCGWSVAGAAGLAAALMRRAASASRERVARASHELRGPLTAARLGVELGSRTGELSPDRLRAIELELERAALALEDLLHAPQRDLVTGTRAPSNRQPVEIRPLLRDLVRAWEPAAAAGGVEVRLRWFGEDGFVAGERIRLAQAIGNLLANAIEHGGDTVEVRGTVADCRVRVEVADDGPGLPAPVSELTARPRNGRGVRGRGLAIASAIATAHGGRVAAAPSDRGARVVLDLPASAPEFGLRRPTA